MSAMRKRGSPGARHLRARLLKRGLALAVSSGLLPALIAIAIASSSAPAHARPLDDVVSSKVLRVVVYDDNAPYSWTDADGTVKGIDADLARAVAGRMGVQAEIIARTAGEEVDDDLRSNIWQGPRTGGVVGDVMMHVPMEREFIARNNLVAISNAYQHEKIVLVVHPDMVDPAKGLSAFRSAKLAVQFATTAHYYAMFADAETLKPNVNPFRKLKGAVASFLSRQNAGILAVRSELESLLAADLASVRLIEPQFDTHLRMAWTIGTAVKHDSRDTGYAFGNALREIETSGELAAIFTKYGVTRVPPPVP